MKKQSRHFGDNSQDLLAPKSADHSKCSTIAPLVYIRYRDHFLSTAIYPNSLATIESECIGWLDKQTADVIWLVYDRSAITLHNQKIDSKGSGLAILKADVLELKQIEYQHPKKGQH